MTGTVHRIRPIQDIAAEFYGPLLSQIVCDQSIVIHRGEKIIRDGATLRLEITRDVGDSLFGMETHRLRFLAKLEKPFWEAQVAYLFPDGRDGTTETLVRQSFMRWKHPLQIIEQPGRHAMEREEQLGQGFTFRSRLEGSFANCGFECSIRAPDGSFCYHMLGSAEMY